MEFRGVGGFPKFQFKNHAQGKTQSPTLVYRPFWLQIRGGPQRLLAIIYSPPN